MTASRPAHPSPALTAVLERERSLAQELARVDDEARAILEEAAANAAARRARIEDEIATAVRALEAEHAEHLRHVIEEKKAEIGRDLDRIEAVDDAIVTALAEHVLTRAIEPEGEP